jgi:hypothetical protein
VNEGPNPIVGVARVAVGRVDGLRRFGGTVQSFLTSLAPLIAFPLAGALIELVREGLLPALTLILVTLVAQLTPPVLSHALARWWGREDQWLHYATAYNWCYWALPVVLALLMIVLGTAAGAGLPQTVAAQGVVAGLAAYSLWLHWFLARHALALSRGKAALLVVLVNAGTLILALGPALLG